MSIDSTSSIGRSPAPVLDQVFTETLATMRGWTVLGTSVIHQTGLIMYTRILDHEQGTYCCCHSLRKNKLKAHIFYTSFPQSTNATIRTPLISIGTHAPPR
jgi:hypothetical protein